MKKLTIIAGNCILENMETSINTAKFLMKMKKKYKFDLIYKSSYLKDNRSKYSHYEGLGIEESKLIFNKLKSYGLTLLTDIAKVDDIQHFNDIIDVYQLPAYLCMQSHLIRELSKTNKPINIKKGQFLHPYDVRHIVKRFEKYGNNKLTITERGTSFGYRDLVVDPRSFQILKEFGYPVYFDVGHSIRKYGISSHKKEGGRKEFVNTLAKSAIATGIDGIFVEVHPQPEIAMCDSATQLSFKEFEQMIKEVIPIWKVVNET